MWKGKESLPRDLTTYLTVGLSLPCAEQKCPGLLCAHSSEMQLCRAAGWGQWLQWRLQQQHKLESCGPKLITQLRRERESVPEHSHRHCLLGCAGLWDVFTSSSSTLAGGLQRSGSETFQNIHTWWVQLKGRAAAQASQHPSKWA